MNGRGRPTNTDWDRHKAYRAQVMREALRTIVALPGVSVGAVYRDTQGSNYRDTKARLYVDLVQHWDSYLNLAGGQWGLVAMDGDGSDPSYRLAHRTLKLSTRYLIEDPFFQGSHTNLWIQMADLIAYVAYMYIVRVETGKFMWNWYNELLAPGSITGGRPMQL